MSSDEPKAYWRSLQERDGDPELARASQDELAETPFSAPDLRVDRRGLMKGFAAVFAGVTLTGCTKGVVSRALPLLVQSETVVPGRATWYATTCGACSAGCGMLVKCRDGRPIKAEGFPGHPISKGGLCAVGHAQVLSLYDPERLRAPRNVGKPATWKDLDDAVRRELDLLRQKGAVRVLTSSVASATVQGSIDRFLARFKDGRHVAYDPLSAAAILEAHARTHGRRVLPRYRFERARAIVSFDADFLGTWISPVEFTAAYAAGRSVVGTPVRFSYHCQLEARLSLTGGNADRRVRLAPGDVGSAVAHVAAGLARKAGVEQPGLDGLGEPPFDAKLLAELVDRLWAARGEALVVCGQNDPDVQTLVNLANHLVGAYGSTVDLDAPSAQLGGNDRDVLELVAEMEVGKVSALLVHGVNPAYDLPEAKRFASALGKVGLTVAFATHHDETARLCRFVAPVPHFLESWGEAEPVAGVVTLTQPAIAPLWDTRPLVESLGRFSGDARSEDELVRTTCAEVHFPRQKTAPGAVAFIDGALHDGHAVVAPPPRAPARMNLGAVAKAPKRAQPGAGKLALVLYPKVGLRDGRHALNPWLQELPDPITKTVWDNYASLSPAAAAALRVEDGSLVRITAGGAAVDLPALVQPGQHDGVVAVALGYGRVGTERFAKVGPQWIEARPTTGSNGLVGASASPLLSWAAGFASLSGAPVEVAALGGKVGLARTQDHHTLRVPPELAMKGHETRPHVRTTTFAAVTSRQGEPVEREGDGASLWPDDFATKGPRWALAIDLNACTGCGACVVSCQAENNVAVVGKDEVRRHREMAWLRIDRYYAGDGDATEVVHQPMLCHHCGNAPCETVCPVAATVHSSDGINQQVYNRCVGTRYCANNCPYKARRFNWFDYPHEDEVERLVLNPDVTVRSRGVMEKCSLCYQRIQEARIEAKRRGEALADGEIRMACEQSCPAKAIVFGDANDTKSEVAARIRDPRSYVVLPELNLRQGVRYLARVRNVNDGGSHRAD